MGLFDKKNQSECPVCGMIGTISKSRCSYCGHDVAKQKIDPSLSSLDPDKQNVSEADSDIQKALNQVLAKKAAEQKNTVLSQKVAEQKSSALQKNVPVKNVYQQVKKSSANPKSVTKPPKAMSGCGRLTFWCFFLLAFLVWCMAIMELIGSYSVPGGAMSNHNIGVVILLISLCVMMFFALGGKLRPLIVMSLLPFSSVLALAKPILAPVTWTWNGVTKPYSLNSETHFMFLVPGFILLGLSVVYFLVFIAKLYRKVTRQ